MHTPDEVVVDPRHPLVARVLAQDVDPAVDPMDEGRPASEQATVC